VSDRYALSDAQWEQIKSLLPGQPGQPGDNGRDNRLFIDAVLYRYCTGTSWRSLPASFGDFRVVHTRFSRWSKRGIWERVLDVLRQDGDDRYAALDVSTLRVRQPKPGPIGPIDPPTA